MNCAKPCLFCLEYPDSSEIVTNPKNVEIQPLLHYLAGVDPSLDIGTSPGSSIPVMAQLPPLCLPCYEKLGQLHQLHKNLLEIQRLIQHLTLEMRKSVRECRIVVDGKRKPKLDTFERSNNFKELHDLIIAEGSNDVIFPSRWRPSPGASVKTPAEPEGDPLMTFKQQQDISMEGDPDNDGFLPFELSNFIKVEHSAPADCNDDDDDPLDLYSECDLVDEASDESDLSDNNDTYLGVETTGKRKSCSKNESEPSMRKSRRVTTTRKKECDEDESDILSDDGGDRDEEWELKYMYVKKGMGSKKKSILEPKKKIKPKKKRDSTEAKFPCQFCNKIYVTYEARCTHKRNKHAEQYAAELQRKQALKSFPYSLSSKPDNVAAQRCPMCITKRKVIWVELSKMDLHLEAHLGDGRQGWKCQVCHEVFPTRSMIIDHIQKNPNCSKANTNHFLKHICALCQPPQNEFETEMDLFNHLFDVHEKDESLEKLHKCKGCNSKYRTELGLDFHVNRHIKMERWKIRVDKGRVPCPKDENLLQKCKLCDEMIPSVEMKHHLTTEHKDRIEEFVFIKCKLCSDEVIDCGDREEYQKHIQSCHNQPNIQKPCDICESEVFDKHHELRKHYFHVHQIGTQYDCEHCKRTLYSKKSLKDHIQKCHKNVEGKFACEFCIKSGDTVNGYLASESSLEQHLANVHPVDRFKCERLQCTAQFRCRADFMEHEKNEHQGDPLKCTDPFCSKEFVHAIFLKSHVEIIHEGKYRLRQSTIMKCSVCDKAFRSVSHLKLHEKIHSEEKPFQCDQCPKSFKTELNFKTHQLTHLPGGRPRPFVCEVCSRAFYTAKMLEQHARIHTGERPFPCQFCGMAFRQKASLRTHELGHKNKQENFRSPGTFERGAKGN